MKTRLVAAILIIVFLQFCTEKEVEPKVPTLAEQLSGDWSLIDVQFEANERDEFNGMILMAKATSDSSGYFELDKTFYETVILPSEISKIIWPEKSYWYFPSTINHPDSKIIWRDSVSVEVQWNETTFSLSFPPLIDDGTECIPEEPEKCILEFSGNWVFTFEPIQAIKPASN